MDVVQLEERLKTHEVMHQTSMRSFDHVIRSSYIGLQVSRNRGRARHPIVLLQVSRDRGRAWHGCVP